MCTESIQVKNRKQSLQLSNRLDSGNLRLQTFHFDKPSRAPCDQEPGTWERSSTPVVTLPLCLQDCTAWAKFFQSLTKTMPSQFYSLLTESCFSSCRVQHGLACQHCGHLPGIKILLSVNSLVQQSWSFWTATVPFKAGSSLRLSNSTIKTRIHLWSSWLYRHM